MYWLTSTCDLDREAVTAVGANACGSDDFNRYAFSASRNVTLSVNRKILPCLDDVHLIASDEVVVATKACAQFYPS